MAYIRERDAAVLLKSVTKKAPPELPKLHTLLGITLTVSAPSKKIGDAPTTEITPAGLIAKTVSILSAAVQT